MRCETHDTARVKSLMDFEFVLEKASPTKFKPPKQLLLSMFISHVIAFQSLSLGSRCDSASGLSLLSFCVSQNKRKSD